FCLPIGHATNQVHATQHIRAFGIRNVNLDLMSRSCKAQIHIAQTAILTHSQKAHGSPVSPEYGTQASLGTFTRRFRGLRRAREEKFLDISKQDAALLELGRTLKRSEE